MSLKVRVSHLRGRNAFTILELIVSVAVFSMMLVLIFSIISQTGSVWRGSTKDLGTFQTARIAFEILTRSVGQATLNSYWDYQFLNGQPPRYRRNSDLQFVLAPSGENGIPGTPGCGHAVFFQALLGKREAGAVDQGASQLLNEVGFFVEFGSDGDYLPTLLKTRLTEKFRYRLYQTVKPTEDTEIYSPTNGTAWIDASNAQPIADNVIALVLAPRRAPAEESARGLLVTETRYDSRANATAYPQPVTAHQLPPFLEVFLVAIDEDSAARIASGASQPSQIVQALNGKFEEVGRLSQDMEELAAELQAQKIQARIFSTRLPMRESKWSEY